MEVALPPADARPSRTLGARARWALLGLLLGVVVAGLVVSAVTVFGRGAGDSIDDKVSSIFDPPTDATGEREEVLAAARTFVQRFNTYGPDLLDANGKMPQYAAVGELMTAKFETVFEKNVGYAEETVKQTDIGRKGTPYGVGLASMDGDSAEVLAAGIVEFSYPAPEGSEEPITFEPYRFRYQVSLVKVGGTWLVDDLDDLDDDLPSFAQASIPGSGTPSSGPSEGASPAEGASPSGSSAPSDDPAPSGSPSDEATSETGEAP